MEFETAPQSSSGFAEAPSAFLRREQSKPQDDRVIKRLGRELTLSGAVSERAIDQFMQFGGRAVAADLFTENIASRRSAKIVPIRTGGKSVIAMPTPVSGDSALLAEFRREFAGPLAQRAAMRRPSDASYRTGPAVWQRALLGGGCASILSLCLLAPIMAASALLTVGSFVIFLNAVLWLSAIAAHFVQKTEEPRLKSPDLPKITILVALYREPETVTMLVKSLDELSYPRESLDVKFVLEEDDTETLEALNKKPLPRRFQILIAPDGEPRTKPRALNFALDFAEGDVIGVYDAEDRPGREQLLQVAACFQAGGPERACVQARLGYYNVHENWLTRCFELEYAAWFDTLLPGLHQLGLPLPLGGTSLFLRRDALEAVGAWDSYNVTEDADLGMALARKGYETALITSLTEEEASSRPGAWVKQRSRWLKGYLATWLTHMRNPRALLRDLGWFRFAGFNVILLGAVLGYLLMGPLWAVSIMIWVGYAPAVEVISTNAMLLAGAFAAPALVMATAIGLRRRNRLRYLPWALTAPLYWFLGAAAAHLAVWELFTAPTKWRKTQHGVGEIAKLLKGAAGHS